MRKPTLVLTLLLASCLAAATAWAAGSKPAPAPPTVAPETPEESGRAAYNLGLEKRDKAWKLEKEAAAASSDAERAKLLEKARKQHLKSISLFKMAVEKVPNFHQAYSSLGYALRKTGDYEAALEAYAKALAIAPRYGEAIEYRGEAYLGLHRIEDAKQAYMDLFSLDRALADQLMTAMQAWLEARRADAMGVSAADLDGFSAWLDERAELAAQTARLTAASERSWGD
jgi:tetratricopeptide (TPR) repeat protein